MTMLMIVLMMALLILPSSASATADAVRHLQTSEYDATAYECDSNNKGLSSSPTKVHGNTIRICLEPSRAAINNDVYILKINSFRFVKREETGGEIVQDAVKNGADADGFNDFTTITCTNGAELCVIESQLGRNFYNTDGRVTGSGEVALQFGKERRHLRVQLRQAQQLAGIADVEMIFFVSNGRSDTQENIDDTKNEISDFWNDSETHMRALYVLVCIIFFLILLCLCLGCCLWERYCGREARKQVIVEEEHPDERDEFIDDDGYGDRGPPRTVYDDPSYNPYDYDSRPGDNSAYPEEEDMSYANRDYDYEANNVGHDDEETSDDDEDDSSEDEEDSNEDSSDSDMESQDDDNDTNDAGQMVPFQQNDNDDGAPDAAASVPPQGDSMVPYQEQAETPAKAKKKKKRKKKPAKNPDEDDAEEEVEPPSTALVAYDANETDTAAAGDETSSALVAHEEPTKKKKKKKKKKKQVDDDGDDGNGEGEGDGQLVNYEEE